MEFTGPPIEFNPVPYLIPKGTPCEVRRKEAESGSWIQHVTKHDNAFNSCDWRKDIFVFSRNGWWLRVEPQYVQTQSDKRT